MSKFAEIFGGPPDGVWQAPGRVNLIGEHTDYNDGVVLPIALPNRIQVTASARADGRIAVASTEHDGVVEFDLSTLAPAGFGPAGTVGAEGGIGAGGTVGAGGAGSAVGAGGAGSTVGAEGAGGAVAAAGAVGGWAAYPAGAAWVLREAGYGIGGANLLIDSDLPSGAGLSSSAALLCATSVALLGLRDISVEPAEVARLAQRAENQYVGAPVGLMDQMASMCCTAGHALYFDIRAMTTEQIPFDPGADDLTLLVVDVKAPHRHVDGEYAARRRSCEEAAALLGVPALRSITVDTLDDALAQLPDPVMRRRVCHVVTEIARVDQTVALLRAGNLRDVGPLFTASHLSMRDDFEITSPELDVAVEAALSTGALGARMTGGGFGGCIIALTDTPNATTTLTTIQKAFTTHAYPTPTALTATPSPGAHRIT